MRHQRGLQSHEPDYRILGFDCQMQRMAMMRKQKAHGAVPRRGGGRHFAG